MPKIITWLIIIGLVAVFVFGFICANDDIRVGLIGLLGALIGSTISIIAQVFFNKHENERWRKTELIRWKQFQIDKLEVRLRDLRERAEQERQHDLMGNSSMTTNEEIRMVEDLISKTKRIIQKELSGNCFE
ncbi:MAG: hypothetical protein MNSN_01640 [Minisyncoccus archaeiphilus]|uniref:hypothetical protein n=1 Tax=Minisyncoccus archaeiphilus TaxID=3238481 RepID=UPI002B11DD98|nr:MAG: hypothetical protein MNSN_01640 [Candidatus Parcubacteria bacterium]